MEIEQTYWTPDREWYPSPPHTLGARADLALVFGGSGLVQQPEHVQKIREFYPNATIIGGSTAGEIFDTQVLDDSLVVTAVHFAHTRVQSTTLRINDPSESYAVGARIAQNLNLPDLAHVIIISEGLNINGTELTRGLTRYIPSNVVVTGGLAADGPRFGTTSVIHNNGSGTKVVTAVGLYSKRLKIGYGSLGGWDVFGPERLITRARGNVLYELDGTSALALYKRYLGEHAAQLPASGLLFPLSLSTGLNSPAVVRTILSVSEAEQSITFAGDMPEGTRAQLMRANFDRLIDGAIGAAEASRGVSQSRPAELALLVSCVGRKLVLQQRIEEEVEGVRDVLGPQAVLAGFYSYGEIAPLRKHDACTLHNQTMTITTFTEC